MYDLDYIILHNGGITALIITPGSQIGSLRGPGFGIGISEAPPPKSPEYFPGPEHKTPFYFKLTYTKA
jgi:hypothetical protein